MFSFYSTLARNFMITQSLSVILLNGDIEYYEERLKIVVEEFSKRQ